jgi:DNA-binding Lrp family transcriptional regulator
MVYGYVLISTKNSFEREVAHKLSLLNEVIDVEPLLVEETALADPFFEEYELIAKIKAKNSEELKNYIDDKINCIYGVEKTKIASRKKL